MKIRTIISELTAILPVSWVMLGLEYGACWWKHQGSFFNAILSVSGAVFLSFILAKIGKSVAYELNGESKAPEKLSSCISRFLGTVLFLAIISSIISE